MSTWSVECWTLLTLNNFHLRYVAEAMGPPTFFQFVNMAGEEAAAVEIKMVNLSYTCFFSTSTTLL